MQKILIILLRTLGDVILCGTLVAELKKKYPDSEITFAVCPEYSEIVDLNPNIKGLIITKDWDVVLQEMSSGKYDKVLCPYQLTHTDTLWHHRNKYMQGHLIDFYAGRCGIEITERKEYIYLKDEDIEEAKRILPEDKIKIAIHTTSLVESKNWDKFEELVKEIRNIDLPMYIIQVGGKDDKEIEGVNISYCGKLGLSQTGAILKGCDLFIGVDSGISYVADGVGCPAICIMGMSTQRTSGPIGKGACFIEPERPDECKANPCHTNCRFKNPCIKTIGVEIVMEKVVAKLKEINPDKPVKLKTLKPMISRQQVEQELPEGSSIYEEGARLIKENERLKAEVERLTREVKKNGK